jgi:hypothetical protein
MAAGESELNEEIDPVITEQDIPEDGFDKEADVCSVEDFNNFFRRFGREDDDTIQVEVNITTPDGDDEAGGGDEDEGEDISTEPTAVDEDVEESVESFLFGFEDDIEGEGGGGEEEPAAEEEGDDMGAGDEEEGGDIDEGTDEGEGEGDLDDSSGEDDVSVGINVNVTVDNETEAGDAEAGDVSQEDFDLFFRRNFGFEDDEVEVTVNVDGETVAEGSSNDEGDSGELEEEEEPAEEPAADPVLEGGDTGELETEEEAGTEDDEGVGGEGDDDDSEGEEDFDYQSIF